VLIILPLRSAIDELKKSDDRLIERIQELEIKVAERYVQREELGKNLRTIVERLDRFESHFTTLFETLRAEKADK